MIGAAHHPARLFPLTGLDDGWLKSQIPLRHARSGILVCPEL